MLLLLYFTHIFTLLFHSLLIWCVCVLSIKLAYFWDGQISKSSVVKISVLWLFFSAVLSSSLKPFAACMLQVTLIHIGLWQTSHLCDTIGRKQNSSWFSSLWTFSSSLFNVLFRCPEQIFRGKDGCGPRVHHNVYPGGWESKLVPGWKYQAFLHWAWFSWQRRRCFPEE